MRLTLRTLLAYLDDLLEPAQTKELGAKIQESEMATELVAKIREVIRKRRLTAPVVGGPGCDLDANLVAEYLDNTLSPEGVTDVERICLESDVHLAEVAASHQILTLALAEPVDVGPMSRERMYALGDSLTNPANGQGAGAVKPASGPASAVLAKPVAASGSSGVFAKPTLTTGVAGTALGGLLPAVKPLSGSRLSSTSIPVPPPVDEGVTQRKADEPFDRTIPDYLRAPPLWKRILPVAIALLVLVWLGMLFTDQEMVKNLLGGKPNPGLALVDNPAGQGAKQQPAADKTALDANAQPPAPGDQLVATKPSEDVKMPTPGTVGEEFRPDAPPPADQPPPADVADGTPPVKLAPPIESQPGISPPAPAKPPGTAVARVDPENPANAVKPTAVKPAVGTTTDAAKPTTVVKPPAKRVTASVAQYDSPDGVVLRYDAERLGWYQLPHRAVVFAEELLAVPEPFDAELRLGKEKHRLTVKGPAIVSVTEPTQDQPLGINLVRGRAILLPAETGSDAAGIPAMKTALTVQGTTWRLELLDATTRCGIEVIPREPRQFDEDFGTQGWSGRLYVWSGGVKITNGEGQERTLLAPETLILATDPVTTKPESPPPLSGDLPSWERKLSNLSQKNARLLEKEFASDEPPSAHDALLGMADSRVYEQSRLAVACLGLIGDYEMLLAVFDRNEHHESRVAAITGLRTWINQAPENRERLKAALEAKFVPKEVEVLYRLIWGYQEQDARDKATSEKLLNWLQHDRLAVRELACYHIRLLSNRKFEFDARGTQMQISTAVQKIARLFDKDGTLLPPLPAKAGGAAF